MAEKIREGNFSAKVIDYAITASKSGDPMACVLFKLVDHDGDSHSLSWYGSFKGGAAKWTCKNLALLGMKGEDPAVLAEGFGNGALNTEMDFEVVVQYETWNEKTFPKIKFINLPGSSKFQNKMDKGEAKLKFQGMDFGGHFAEAREEMPKGIDSSEEIPF
jgi:hypothetical protein